MPTIVSLGNNTSVASSQSNLTNWPSLGFSLTGYPNTLYGPASNLGLNTYLNLTATNSSATAITIHYAGSDGYYWWSNYFVQTITILANTNTIQFWTNTATGALPYMTLQQIDNPGATGALTNIVITESEKPGL